jgi:hypothetical protein
VKDEFIASSQRLSEISNLINLPIGICFCVREFETWFLECLLHLRENNSDIGWSDRPIPEFPLSIRGEKEEFEQHIGTKYRPSVDQEKFAKRLDLKILTQNSRSYRKFARATTGLTYEEIFEVIS